MDKRYYLHINGVVQGVGFRPLIFRLAHEHGLAGWVSNGAGGVEIEVQGPISALDGFVRAVKENPPALAQIEELECEEVEVAEDNGFRIKVSEDEGEHHPVIGPDAATCAACTEELFDSANRRYGHPFISCVDCGARYTIIEGVPYDREKTSMRIFDQCPECEKEYTNSGDRRFHSQTNCCRRCGPKLELYDNKRRQIEDGDLIDAVRGFLADGKIVAIKGLGGFHLACDATSDEAVSELRRRKGRGNKPFAVMVGAVEQVRQICQVNNREAELLSSKASPIVLLRRLAESEVSAEVAPGNNYLGVMLAYTGIHHLIMAESKPMVMTSGNIADEAIIANNDEAFDKLSDVADYFLVHDREIRYRCDDSVAKVLDGEVQLLRRSRGYTPRVIELGREFPSVLAVGGQMKNTICFLKGNKALLSQHLGDMDNAGAYEFFQETLGHLGELLSFKPVAVAHDMHPGYETSGFAKDMSIGRKIPVQHHEAHVAGCLAQHGVLDEEIIGLSFDGTGYGRDGCIWGGEVFVGKVPKLKRAGHFDYVAMPGGELAIKEPWRMAVSYLKKVFGRDYKNLPLAILEKFSQQLPAIDKLIERRINSPLTSSCGRLFDAVSALIGLCYLNTFEGEAAITLEMAIEQSEAKAYPYKLGKDDSGYYVVNFDSLIRAIVADMKEAIPAGIISRKFHQTIVELCGDIVNRLSGETGIKKVVMTGGVFQSNFLHTELKRLLVQNGFEVYANTITPPNDGGISLGQAVMAGMILQGEE